MKRGSYIIVFGIGAAIGSLVTWQCVKKRYERIAQEEIDSVKEVFSRKEAAVSEPGEEVDPSIEVVEGPDISDYEDKVDALGYTGKEKEAEETMDKPYIIKPEEFGEFSDYERISLTYYADGMLADEDDELIEDVESIVGFDSLSHFGEYEEDSVFVRNDRLKCDYEILLDHRKYTEVSN